MAVYSFPDCRNSTPFPNLAVAVQLTNFYLTSSDPSHADPVDSRAAGAPADCRKAANIPNNCRNSPPF
jgi:hypothetical protein